MLTNTVTVLVFFAELLHGDGAVLECRAWHLLFGFAQAIHNELCLSTIHTWSFEDKGIVLLKVSLAY